MHSIKKGKDGSDSTIAHELPLAVFSRWSLCAATACALLLAGAAQVTAADFTVKPSLAISEEYTDNVFENSTNKRSDYITRARPGLALKYNAPFWDWDLGYIFDYRYYAKGSRSNETVHNGNLKGLLKLVDEKLFLELSDVYKRVSLDVTRDTTNESLYQNQSDQNVGIVSPYLVLRPTAQLTLKSGYRYINTWYKDPQAVSRQDHVGFINSTYELSPTFFLTGDYTFTRQIPVRNSSFYRHEAYLGPRHEYAEKSFIYVQGGFIASDYDNGTHLLNPSWRAGLTHSFDTLTANVSTATRYSDDPLGVSTLETSYSASLTKTLQRGSLTLQGSYTEFSDANTDTLKNKRLSGGFSSVFEITQDLRSTLGLTYEKYRNLLPGGTTDKYFVDCGLNYNFGKELTAGLTYKYIDYSSARIVADNKQVNRVMLEVKKTF
ncbi:MAG: TIGR03016 family PEP-CTERM system-associated outer membrane protein, partial [Steroidobacteraceae bacterium]|nr:TIGR03016 family PEP-CTERM system-associated outer membrane protein [Deltaproteobacteria bacterium]